MEKERLQLILLILSFNNRFMTVYYNLELFTSMMHMKLHYSSHGYGDRDFEAYSPLSNNSLNRCSCRFTDGKSKSNFTIEKCGAEVEIRKNKHRGM